MIKICIGWLLNTRYLLVILPEHKYIAWTSQVQKLMDRHSKTNEKLEPFLGQLEQIAIIIKMFGHSLYTIQSLQIKASKTDHNILITSNAQVDLTLAKRFLINIKICVSMNSIVFWLPEYIYM